MDSDTASKVNEQVRNIIGEAESEARRILNKEKSKLEKLGQALMKKETISADEVRELLIYPKSFNAESSTQQWFREPILAAA